MTGAVSGEVHRLKAGNGIEQEVTEDTEGVSDEDTNFTNSGPDGA
jgi:hypothetical protein